MELLPVIVVYWLFLTGTVFIVGGFLSKSFVTNPSGVDACLIEGSKECFGELSSRYIFYATVITFLMNLIHLILHISYFTETPLNQISSVFILFLTKTYYGKISLFRTVLIATLIPISYLTIRHTSKWYTYIATLVGLLVLLAFSMTSHQAQKGFFRLPLYIDFFHIFSISTWIGGILFIRFCYSFFLTTNAEHLFDNFTKMIKKYSDLATYSVYVVLVTGAVLVLIRIKNLYMFTSSIYAEVLVMKIVTVIIILLLGAINKFFIVPSIQNKTANDWSNLLKKRNILYNFVTFEAILGLLVLLLTAFLTHMSPEG